MRGLTFRREVVFCGKLSCLRGMNPSPQAAEEVPNWMLEELQTELFEKNI
jgi:hypothetical protein